MDPPFSAKRALAGPDVELVALISAASEPSAVVSAEGEAGIGKTRLVAVLAVLAGHAELAGRRLLAGRCRQIRESFPLGPVIEAVRGAAPEVAGLWLSLVAGSLRPLLPELSEALPPAVEPLDDRAAQRHRVRGRAGAARW